MYNYDWNPYVIDPSQYVQQALEPVQGNQPVMPQMTPEQKYFGPAHEALSNYFQQAIARQLGVPGLLSEMQQNPGMAQQIGGLLGGAYTPQSFPHDTIDWAKAAETAKAMKV